MESGAVISPCGKYRYKLWRIWDDEKPKVLFVMHNPSTADHRKDDPTIRRCISFAKSWGYGGIYVGNLIPYRATNPDELKLIIRDRLVPAENEVHIEEMKEKTTLHILAYGNPVVEVHRPILFNEKWQYLKLTKKDFPCHPLYLKGDLKPIPFITEMEKENELKEGEFKCKGCGHILDNSYSLRSPDYCYLCDPAIELKELLSDKLIEKESLEEKLNRLTNNLSERLHREKRKLYDSFINEVLNELLIVAHKETGLKQGDIVFTPLSKSYHLFECFQVNIEEGYFYIESCSYHLEKDMKTVGFKSRVLLNKPFELKDRNQAHLLPEKRAYSIRILS